MTGFKLKEQRIRYNKWGRYYEEIALCVPTDILK